MYVLEINQGSCANFAKALFQFGKESYTEQSKGKKGVRNWQAMESNEREGSLKEHGKIEVETHHTFD